MLFYILNIKKKNINNCDSLEKYVKRCIEEKSTVFFPTNMALQIKKENDEADEENIN
jgi:inositol 1,4,5-triphosphate receptor type 1